MNPSNTNKEYLRKKVKKPKIILTDDEDTDIKDVNQKIKEKIQEEIQQEIQEEIQEENETKQLKTDYIESEKLVSIVTTERQETKKKTTKDISIKETIDDKFYQYKIPLETNFKKLILKQNDRIKICCYRVNTQSLKPYIEYCLFKYPESKDERISDLMIFPYIKYNKDQTIENQSNEFVTKFFNETIESQGYIIHNKEPYIFYQLNEKNNKEKNIQEKKRNEQWWWCLIDEIVNYKKTLNFSIHKNVYSFFLSNPSFCFLLDRVNNIIETPVVGYHGTYYGLIPLIKNFGLQPSTLYAMMGPYYYFGTFRKAVRYAGWTSTYKPRKIDGKIVADNEGRYKKGGILRFVVFQGNMRVLTNHPQDDDDFSNLVKERIKENPRSKKYEFMTLKLHDHKGKWTEHYDSIYIGRAKLKNGRNFMANPEFVVKDETQFQLLTTHILDKNTLKKNWDNSYEKYNIL